MKLYYGKTSPYARKVRIALKEKGLLAELINTPPLEPNTPLGTINPLGKVPALYTKDGSVLIDSPLICAYLDSLSPQAPLIPNSAEKWTILNLEALCDGIMDAAFSLTMEKNRETNEQSDFWMKRWSSSIKRTLNFIEENLRNFEGDLTVAQISLGSALDYLLFRRSEIQWQKNNPGIAEWHAKFSQRESMKTTHPEYNGEDK